MQVEEKIIAVTGAGRGIGRAIVERMHREGAAGICVVDRDQSLAESVASDFGALAIECDVAVESQMQEMVEQATRRFGRIDVLVSNAGVTSKGGLELPDAEWERQWKINVMSHVYGARAVVPGMLERGEGYLVQIASAAGLLTEIGSAPYSVTKHGAVAMAEWLQVQYGHRGIQVSCVCPMGVDTDMLEDGDPVHDFLARSAVSPEQVAECIVRGMEEERFLILPHEDVGFFAEMKQRDYDRWLHNMNRLHTKLERRAG